MRSRSPVGVAQLWIVRPIDGFMLQDYFQPMEHDFMKRGYLLPKGCKDLIDALEQPKQLSSKHPVILIDKKLMKYFDGNVKPHFFKFKPIKPF